MPDFERRRNQPMTASSYRSAARNLRGIADSIESRADAATPREARARSAAIERIRDYAEHLSQRDRLGGPADANGNGRQVWCERCEAHVPPRIERDDHSCPACGLVL